jgi:hypothetical protein
LTPEEEVKVLLRDLKGRMGPSPYDIAWMARVPAGGGGSARWPDLIDWLIANQWLDGSWGGEIVYYHLYVGRHHRAERTRGKPGGRRGY